MNPRGNPEKIAAHKFKKGQSGNPAGRPPGQGITDILRHMMAREIKMKDPFEPAKTITLTLKESLALALYAKGRKGSEKAIEMIFDRLDGKVAQPMKLTGPSGAAVNINMESNLPLLDEKNLKELGDKLDAILRTPQPKPDN